MTPRLRTAAAAVVLTVPLLSSCGFDAPTDQIYTPAQGVNERGGSVDVLNALVVSGADGSGTLIAALVNNDQLNDDVLTGVAGVGDDASITVELAGNQVNVPAGELVQLAEDGSVSVEADQIEPGRFVELQLTFERGETVRVQAPVVPRDQQYAEVPVPSVAPTTEAPAETPAEH